MILNPSPISSTRFNFKGHTFIAEASELRNFCLGQVYDDACDLGFTIISAKTGKGAVFVENDPEKDAEGDVLAWNFKCITSGLTHLKAVIYND